MFISAIGFFVVLGALLGLALGYAAKVFHVESNPLVDQIENMLPGGQCGQCGEAGCRQAAEKMVEGSLGPNCCPPGGAALSLSVAELLGISVEVDEEERPVVAYIAEDNCSGCGRCFKACPFDAIVGAPKQMHTIITEVCTGCGLCEKTCAQGCLSLSEAEVDSSQWYWPKPKQAVAI